MKRVEILHQQRLLDDYLKVDEAILRHELLEGGMSPPLRRLSLERGDGVAALVRELRRDRLILVRQFRYPTYARGPGWTLEIVAGMLVGEEAPEAAVRREILEETGYLTARLRPISTFYLSPGGSSERIFLFYAEADEETRRHVGGGLDQENEDIEVVDVGVEEAWQALDQGEIVDAKTIIALMWMRRDLGPR